MMRGKKVMVTAVRRPDGSIVTRPENLPSFYTGWARKTPVLRGIIVLIESLLLGYQTLTYSADVALDQEEKSGSNSWLWTLMMAIGVIIAVAFFFVVPLFITRLFHIQSSLLFNIVDGLIRLAIFVAYLIAVSSMKTIQRVFAYHGAEHMAVNAYEDGTPLEVEKIRKYSTAHPRCGTSFLFIVMVIAIIAFAIVGKPALWIMVLSRIVLIPVIAALSYEVTAYAGRHTKHWMVRIILAPGMWLQSLTTRKPDDSMLEVSTIALKKVIELEENPV